MTFGYFSEGFDPVHCPPCASDPTSYCNAICMDPIDGPLLLLLVFVPTVIALSHARTRERASS